MSTDQTIQLKGKELSNWIKKQNPAMCYLEETHCKDTKWFKVKGWEEIYDTNTEENKAGVAILISGKAGFRAGSINGDKNDKYVNPTVTYNSTWFSYVQQYSWKIHKAKVEETKRVIDTFIIKVRDGRTPLSVISSPSSKDVKHLNMISWFALMTTHRAFHWTTAEYTCPFVFA